MDDESSISDDSLTAEKWRELGSPEAVEKSRRQPQSRTRNQMAGKSNRFMVLITINYFTLFQKITDYKYWYPRQFTLCKKKNKKNNYYRC